LASSWGRLLTTSEVRPSRWVSDAPQFSWLQPWRLVFRNSEWNAFNTFLQFLFFITSAGASSPIIS
jgi:hypothetical protein